MAPAVALPGSVLLYVGFNPVGDDLVKLPFLRRLRNAFPSARITWLAGKGKPADARGVARRVGRARMRRAQDHGGEESPRFRGETR